MLPPEGSQDTRAVRIERAYAGLMPGAPDPRADPRIIEVLGEVGRLAP